MQKTPLRLMLIMIAPTAVVILPVFFTLTPGPPEICPRRLRLLVAYRPAGYVLDAREGEIARLEARGTTEACTFPVPASVLPVDAVEGDILTVDINTVDTPTQRRGAHRSHCLPLSVDRTATDAARLRVRSVLDTLRTP